MYDFENKPSVKESGKRAVSKNPSQKYFSYNSPFPVFDQKCSLRKSLWRPTTYAVRESQESKDPGYFSKTKSIQLPGN